MYTLKPWSGHKGQVLVEAAEGQAWHVLSTLDEMECLIGHLNKKGARERSLHSNLKHHLDKLTAALQPFENPLDITQIPR